MTQGTLQSKQAIRQLVELSRIRVWSVVITIFGDAVVQRGGVVASSTLAILTAEMGVKPEAFRVAMSRLTKDGLIERTKKGRLSFYQLTQKSASDFEPATKRIYAKNAGSSDGWRVIVMQNAIEDVSSDAISLGGRTYLTKAQKAVPDGFVMSGQFENIPDWVKARIGAQDVLQGYRDLFGVLQDISPRNLSPLDAAVLRLLIVHQWRRLVLRHGDLPLSFFPTGWRGEDCRAIVHQLLADLAPAADDWFNTEIR